MERAKKQKLAASRNIPQLDQNMSRNGLKSLSQICFLFLQPNDHKFPQEVKPQNLQ